MIVGASNDGQLHVFDAGIWDAGTKKFSDGTGKELFSFMPRMSLPLIREFGLRTRQIMGIDGTPASDDVFIDPINNGTPTAASREWRTVIIGGYREGGRFNTGGEKFLDDFVSGYYALDVTQPDTITAGAPSTGVVPSCLAIDNTAVAGCNVNPAKQLPFPALLWEFTDSILGSRIDEDDLNNDGTPDGNASPDLGQTWSSPTITKVRVIDGGTLQDRYVAIFGGGFDGENKPSPQSGNFLYMIDIETGKTLYKRQVVGAVAGDPAVVDVDLNGVADRIYFGTTAGFVYKVDIASPGVVGNVILNKSRFLPALGTDQTVKRVTDAGWKPFPIFDTGGKPIYTPVAPIFDQRLTKFAVGFGTGDREDLWNFGQPEGRYYLVLDDNFLASEVGVGGARNLPKVETNFKSMLVGSGANPATADFIASPTSPEQAGWFLRLNADERVITQTFALAGVLVFSSFQPVIEPVPGPTPTCRRSGESHIFVLNFLNANPLVSGRSRFSVVPKFVTSPYAEINATKNEPPTSGHHSESDDKVDQEIINTIKKMMPRDCKYGNFWFSVSGIRSDTGYERYASIPVCFVERDFKEY
jgi:Tfp pilus tip-associated adhesin PilY1